MKSFITLCLAFLSLHCTLNAQSAFFNKDSLSGNVPVLQTVNLEFSGSGSGSGVTVDSLYVTGIDQNMFAPSSVIQGTPLTSTATTFSVAYTPADTGIHAAVLNIATTEGGMSFTYTINLSGHGDYKKLYFPYDANFGDVEFKSLNNDLSIPVSAVGGMDVTITNVEVVCCGDVIWLEEELPIVVSGDGTPRNLRFRVNPVSFIGMSDADIRVFNDGVSPEVANLVQYNVVGPEPTIDNDQVDLYVGVGSYQDTVITIRNNGTLPFDVEGINFFYEPEHFSLLGNPSFPITLEPGASADFTVRCQPLSFPDHNIYRRFYSGMDIKTEVSSEVVSLFCYVQSPNLIMQFKRSPIGFLETGATPVSRSVNFENKGNEDLIVTDISFVDPLQNTFTINPPALPLTVAPNATATIEFTGYAPASGITEEQYTITSNSAIIVDTFSVYVKGLDARISTDTINLGQAGVVTGTPTAVATEIKSIGDYKLTITDITISGPDAALFSITDLNLPLEIQAATWTDNAYNLNMQFAPVAAGTFNAQLNVTSNSPTSPDVIPITGEGVLVPRFFSDSTTFSFGAVGIGVGAAEAYPIKNIGSAPLTITSATTKYSPNTFYADTTNLPRTIAPGDTMHLMINFEPFNSQYRSGEINIYTNDSSNAKVILPVYGNGESGKMTLSTQHVDFGNIFAGSGDTMTVTVTNTGLGNSYLRNSGNYSSGDFSYYIVGLPFIYPRHDTLVSPGESFELKVICNPTHIGYNKNSLFIELPWGIGWTASKKTFTASYTGEEPPNVQVGGMLFEADNIVVNGDLRTLSGNVKSGDIYYTGEVTIDLATNEVSGSGDVYTKDVAQQGIFGGEEVKLSVGGFTYAVDPLEPKLVQKAGIAATNAGFKLVGLPLSVTRFDVLPNGAGLVVGGRVKLPEEVFGAAAFIRIDSMYINNDGIKVAGKAALNPDLKVYGTFQLKNAKVAFNTFENYFSGGATIGLDLMGKGVTIGAGLVIKNSGLDSLGLEVEVSPGIPIGTTGLALAGGNGFVDGLQVGPLAIGLGVDIIPAVPGPETIRLNNVGVSYTFGTSFNASGTLQLFGENIAGAKYYASTTKTSLEMFVNLLNFFKGKAKILIVTEGGGMQVEGGANLAVIIPKEVPGCSVCGAFKFALPFTVASASAYFKNDIVKANVTILEIFKVGAAVKFKDGKAQLLVGDNYTNLNASAIAFSSSGRLAESGISFENNEALMAENKLEGQSIIFDPGYGRVNSSARTTEPEGKTNFNFNIASQQDHIIIRLTGTTFTPEYSVVLPNGIEINQTNASGYGHIFNPDHDMLQSFYTIVNALPGAYQLIVNGTEPVEIDFFGAEFGPELVINEVSSTFNNVVTIDWKDEDLDSDANISFFYDTDKKDANGLPIIRNLSEDDETDSYSWYAEDLKPGDYYVYGVIDDGKNAPVAVYLDTLFTISGASVIQAPILEVPTQDADTITLIWNKIMEASKYVVYYDEATVTSSSPNFSAGDTTQYRFTGLTPGRTYHFVVTALDEDFNESDFSNEVILNYLSPVNNSPEITTSVFPDEVHIGGNYSATVNYTDVDPSDELTLSLAVSPSGLSLNSGQLTWSPDATQVGQHEVKLILTDDKGAKDSVSFYITVFDDFSSTGVITTSGYQFNGAGQEVSISLTDPDLNSNEDAVDIGYITLTSGFENVGISIEMVETGINTGVFFGNFTFQAGTSNSSENIIGTMNIDTVLITYIDLIPSATVTKKVIYEASETLNKLPSSLSLDNETILENTSNGDLIGLLSATDPDEGDVLTYTLVSGVGDGSNDLFIIEGAALKADMDFTGLTQEFFNVRVRCTDNKGGFFERTFALRNSGVTGVKEEALYTRIELYPNPTSKKVYVTMEGANQGEVVVNIVSLNGLILMTKDFHKNAYSADLGINISRLEEGIYFVQVIQNGEVVNKKLIKK